MAEDRRVRKTKKAIQDVFCELVREKKLNEITIKELCAKADINKSTFYLHYRDIYHLADTIQDILIQDVCSVIAEYSYDEIVTKAPEIWARIEEMHFSESNALGMLVRHTGMKSLVREFERAVIATIMKKYEEAGVDKNSEEYFKHHLYATFIIHGYVGVLREFDRSEMERAMLEVSECLGTGFQVQES